MALVLIIDTSVFLNVLDVPAFNQNRDAVLAEFADHIAAAGTSLLLPMAAVFEAGNHIAQLKDGRQRRKYAEIFADQVAQALDGSAPWQPTAMPDATAIRGWLAEYPDCAMRGVSMGDLSIIKEWEAACKRHPHHHVRIWSLDGALTGYDREP